MVRQNKTRDLKIDRALLYDVFNGCCYLCGVEVPWDDWQTDHVQPLSRGGTHAYSNVAVACGACNLAKRTKTLAEFSYGLR